MAFEGGPLVFRVNQVVLWALKNKNVGPFGFPAGTFLWNDSKSATSSERNPKV